MDTYVPWPVKGCTLSEARERTANRELWKEYVARTDGLRSLVTGTGTGRIYRELGYERRKPERLERFLADVEANINQAFRGLLAGGQLLSYGRKRTLEAAPELIELDLWPAFSALDWQVSSAGENRTGGFVYLAIHVLPAVKTPLAAELANGKSLVDAFRQLVLEDPEVAVLSEAATKLWPAFGKIVPGGQCSPMGDNPWAVAADDPTLLTLGEGTSWAGLIMPRVPRAALVAAGGIGDRCRSFFDLLRRGDLIARGYSARRGAVDDILSSLWAHPESYIDAQTGDFLQENASSTDPNASSYVRRWTALMLFRPERRSVSGSEAAESEAQASSRQDRVGHAVSPRAGSIDQPRAPYWVGRPADSHAC